ncbi:hypothetical protein INT47_009369 [Mucor saturninus]|uniref:Uncharacterized protein n=1 Tax=Mucor saturninus TaxID=64648 RepID=A0A8H7R5Q1_9FUNG|nr:hypothetical protein INT47_009369 [Mucor saturninus]
MCDLNWCTVCDKAISCQSDSLYCSADCYSRDADSDSSHNFQSFFAPKTSSVTFNKQISLMDDMPSLTTSLYTTSTASSSIFTRRSVLLTKPQDEKENNLSCCDYCESVNKKNTGLSSLSQSIYIPSTH